MAYRVLGFVVWHLAKWYVRRRAAQALPSRRLLTAGAVGLGVVALVVVGARRGD